MDRKLANTLVKTAYLLIMADGALMHDSITQSVMITRLQNVGFYHTVVDKKNVHEKKTLYNARIASAQIVIKDFIQQSGRVTDVLKTERVLCPLYFGAHCDLAIGLF